MHALVNVPLPAHDEKTDAVELYSETVFTVQSADKIKTFERRAYKILRPAGREHGIMWAFFDPRRKVNSMHGWCIPAQGKDYEVKDKDAIETSLPGVAGGELYTDTRVKLIQIPAAQPGNIVGYEMEIDEQPYVLQDGWVFQDTDPVREAHYTLQLPPGWEYKATWMNYPEVKPVEAGNNQWQWVVSGVKAIRAEDYMPAWRSVAGQLILSLFPPGGGGQSRGFTNWSEVGTWYWGLFTGRFDASPDIKKKVADLTASAPTPLDKMRALAQFMQHDIRYVAIELGIGGWQPHPAGDVFTHRYGDCKDKATLMSAMLHEIGVTSYNVLINPTRGAVTPTSPPFMGGFGHQILAIRLPEGVQGPSLAAVVNDPKLGRLLFFDPTDEMTPFGYLLGPLQSNYGLVVTPDGGQMMELPELSPATNGVRRTAKLTLDANGTLKGDIEEVRTGDRAWAQRLAQREVTKDADRVKPIESLLSQSLAAYKITHATIGNLTLTDLPFVFRYSIVAEDYAKRAGNLLLVRPRVVGSKSSDFLETKEPRQYPVEFNGPYRDTDEFEITIPTGYQVDDLPPSATVDDGFASYHSKVESDGHVVRYTRTFEVKELSVPVAKVDQLKKLYRIISSDERNTAVLRPASQ